MRRSRPTSPRCARPGLNIMMSMKGDGKAGVVHRGLRGRSGGPRRLHRTAERGVRAARHQGHLVRACLGRLPACAPGAEHEGPDRRRHDARRRRGMLCPGARIQGLAQRRTRRRPGAQRVPRDDVRRAHRPRVRDGEGRVRSERHAEPGPHRAPAAHGRPHAVPLRPGLRADPRFHAEARLVGASRPAGRHAGRGRDVQQQRHLPRASTPA